MEVVAEAHVDAAGIPGRRSSRKLESTEAAASARQLEHELLTGEMAGVGQSRGRDQVPGEGSRERSIQRGADGEPETQRGGQAKAGFELVHAGSTNADAVRKLRLGHAPRTTTSLQLVAQRRRSAPGLEVARKLVIGSSPAHASTVTYGPYAPITALAG